ncbi:MAG: hypothetical protein DBX55_05080 [Verrucomicrobia bacterium]|nr:MAG: hypothetical protein DBX55_05080 [Verrucomicrobiota bacterium]
MCAYLCVESRAGTYHRIVRQTLPPPLGEMRFFARRKRAMMSRRFRSGFLRILRLGKFLCPLFAVGKGQFRRRLESALTIESATVSGEGGGNSAAFVRARVQKRGYEDARIRTSSSTLAKTLLPLERFRAIYSARFYNERAVSSCAPVGAMRILRRIRRARFSFCVKSSAKISFFERAKSSRFGGRR